MKKTTTITFSPQIYATNETYKFSLEFSSRKIYRMPEHTSITSVKQETVNTTGLYTAEFYQKKKTNSF